MNSALKYSAMKYSSYFVGKRFVGHRDFIHIPKLEPVQSEERM